MSQSCGKIGVDIPRGHPHAHCYTPTKLKARLHRRRTTVTSDALNVIQGVSFIKCFATIPIVSILYLSFDLYLHSSKLFFIFCLGGCLPPTLPGGLTAPLCPQLVFLTLPCLRYVLYCMPPSSGDSDCTVESQFAVISLVRSPHHYGHRCSAPLSFYSTKNMTRKGPSNMVTS